MICSLVAVVSALAIGAASPARAETHQVILTNNCGSGNAVFSLGSTKNKLYSSGYVVDGAADGGLAWLTDYANCGNANAQNCGAVEFTLTDPGSGGAQNSADYTLQNMGPGDYHDFQYPMNFAFTGSCTKSAPGQCSSAGNCPGAFTGSNPADGSPVQCVASDTGIHITFC